MSLTGMFKKRRKAQRSIEQFVSIAAVRKGRKGESDSDEAFSDASDGPDEVSYCSDDEDAAFASVSQNAAKFAQQQMDAASADAVESQRVADELNRRYAPEKATEPSVSTTSSGRVLKRRRIAIPDADDDEALDEDSDQPLFQEEDAEEDDDDDDDDDDDVDEEDEDVGPATVDGLQPSEDDEDDDEDVYREEDDDEPEDEEDDDEEEEEKEEKEHGPRANFRETVVVSDSDCSADHGGKKKKPKSTRQPSSVVADVEQPHDVDDGEPDLVFNPPGRAAARSDEKIRSSNPSRKRKALGDPVDDNTDLKVGASLADDVDAVAAQNLDVVANSKVPAVVDDTDQKSPVAKKKDSKPKSIAKVKKIFNDRGKRLVDEGVSKECSGFCVSVCMRMHSTSQRDQQSDTDHTDDQSTVESIRNDAISLATHFSDCYTQVLAAGDKVSPPPPGATKTATKCVIRLADHVANMAKIGQQKKQARARPRFSSFHFETFAQFRHRLTRDEAVFVSAVFAIWFRTQSMATVLEQMRKHLYQRKLVSDAASSSASVVVPSAPVDVVSKVTGASVDSSAGKTESHREHVLKKIKTVVDKSLSETKEASGLPDAAPSKPQNPAEHIVFKVEDLSKLADPKVMKMLRKAMALEKSGASVVLQKLITLPGRETEATQVADFANFFPGFGVLERLKKCKDTDEESVDTLLVFGRTDFDHKDWAQWQFSHVSHHMKRMLTNIRCLNSDQAGDVLDLMMNRPIEKLSPVYCLARMAAWFPDLKIYEKLEEVARQSDVDADQLLV